MAKLDYQYSSIPTFKTLEDIKDKKVTIMGLGLNGGGEASARFFLKHGAFVTITDMKTEEQLSATIKKLNDDRTLPHERIKYVLGQHRIEDFEKADCVIKNPGVKFDGNKFLLAAKNIETDISIFLHFTKAPIIAVTGSKGKSSTVSAIHYGLTQAGFTSFLGGNITVSPLTFLDQTNEKTPVVLELSSWQLSDLRGRNLLKPKISLITKIVPDHQNWYGAMEPYIADKKLIFENQDENSYSIFTFDDEWGNLFSKESKAKILRYSNSTEQKNGCWIDKNNKAFIKTFLDEKEKLVLENLSVPGKHMKENILNASLVLRLFNVEIEKINSIMANFPGIQHRLEFFHQWQNKNGVNFKFYNDSAATVPEAANEAINSFSTSPIMICGGTDKMLDFTSLAENAGKTKKLFLLSGTGTDKLIPLIEKEKTSFEKPSSSLDELFSKVKPYLESISDEKEIPVVFSPGATSFGMFNNEFDRGNKYKEKVKSLF